MHSALETILLEDCGLRKDRPILAGVSGGPDSLCLLGMLHDAGWLVIAAYFNHMLRPEAEAESTAVETLAGRLGIPFAGGGGDVRQYAADRKLSIETAARDLRYRYLFAQSHEREAQAVAVGHTADDQVETVLMHFLRGAGLNGLKGMPYRTTLPEYDAEMPLVRPLLDLWRADTVAYCEARGWQAQYDASNDSVDTLRNRVRHELIPSLRTYNPRFKEALRRTGKTLAADYELIMRAVEPLWQKAVVQRGDGYMALDAGFVLEQPTGLQMHLLRQAVQGLRPGHDTGYEDLQRAADFLAQAAQDRVDFVGGLFLLHESDVLYVAADEEALPRDQWPQMNSDMDSMVLTIPATVDLALGWRFEAAVWKPGDPELSDWEDPHLSRVYLDASSLPAQLELRVRRAGDRFEPLGMGGHSQKLSDFFINAKIPRRMRARWPLVCVGDHIVWIPGYRFAHAHRNERDTSKFLCLSLIAPEHFAGDISRSNFRAVP